MAWSGAVGIDQPETVAGLSAIAAEDGELKAALLAIAEAMESEPGTIDSARLEGWLRANSGIEVDQLTLREAGTDENSAPQWTLELRVEPDKGSRSL